ncbi:MAG: right-handed parallel beta-helix repeat-containing protein [Candidatus Bathyarchaeota archaeon]|nr:right-handed parallel beta-helix repeat-containing protein [Candidatus Bathyarchaeota archaeon]
MAKSAVMMPDGKPFVFWDDGTKYSRRVYHVACKHKAASDEGPGTEDEPFATIGRAAQILEPAERVIVHSGVYRECVRPTRGGGSEKSMIAYEAAPGEDVCVRGSEPWTPEFRPSGGWNLGAVPEGVTFWMGDLPSRWFVGYNPFMTRNFSSEYTTFTRDWTKEEINTFMLRRGMIFANGQSLKQVFHPEELGNEDGSFWVEDPGLKIHLRLRHDGDPKDVTLEVTTREQVFAPLEPGLGYIRVSGFHFEHAADGIPVPQRAMVSATRGHHWIIEDNKIRWANACGIDVGNETWHRIRPASGYPSGHHIIRRNHISDCGICGIAAVANNKNTLVEDNTVERIGDKNIERIWETGGLKFHLCDTVLIRNNVFRHIRHAPGVWLDYLNRNSRITGNVFADIESIHGGVYLEVSHAPNVIDKNIFWDIRGVEHPRSGTGVNVDTGEQSVVAHNLFAKIRDGFAVSVNLDQSSRPVDGRVGLCRRHKILNNVFVECPHRILLSRTSENLCDNNLFENRDDILSFCIEYPKPQTLVNLDAWRDYYGFDKGGGQARIQGDFDPEELVLSIEIDGDVPTCASVPELHGQEGRTVGPVDLAPGRQQYELWKTRFHLKRPMPEER